MKSVKINLNSIDKVKKFVNILSAAPCDCDLASETSRYIVDAKSIMGIFSLNLSKDLTLNIYAETDGVADMIANSVAEFIV